MPGDTIVAYHGVFGVTGNTQTVLCHEITHQFQRKILKGDNAPKWMIEGLAVLFEDSLEKDGKIVFQEKGSDDLGIIPRERLYQLKRSLRGGQCYTPRDLIGMDPGRFGGAQYAPSWSLVYWLMNAEGGKHRGVLEGLWETAVEERLTPREVTKRLEGSVGMKMKDFEAKLWRPYFEGLRIPPPGTVRGNRYKSHRRNFAFRAPASWGFRFDEEGEDFRIDRECRLVHKRLEGAQMEVIALPVQQEAGKDRMDDEIIEKVITRIESLYHADDPERKDIQVHGQRAVRFAFVDRGVSGGAFESDEESTATAHFLVCVPMADRYYEFHASCAVGDGEKVGKDFDKVVKSIRIYD